MNALAFIGLLVLVGAGLLVIVVGIQIFCGLAMFTGSSEWCALIPIGIGAALLWLAYSLSPFSIIVKVAS